MELLKFAVDWIWALLSAFGAYLMYQHKRADSRIDALDRRIDHLEAQLHILDKSQIEMFVEVRELKNDIKELKTSVDRLVDRLYGIIEKS